MSVKLETQPSYPHSAAGYMQPPPAGYSAASAATAALFRHRDMEPAAYHSAAMYSSLHDPFGLHADMGASHGNYYGNMAAGYGYMSPYYRYMTRQGANLKQEMTCEWIDQDTKKICKKTYYTMHDIVTHLTVDHVGGPEITDNACYWTNCPREVGAHTYELHQHCNHICIFRGDHSKRSTNLSTISECTPVRNHFPVHIMDAARPLPGQRTSRFTREYTQVIF